MLFTVSEHISRPVFNLNKYNRAAVFHDQVDLSASDAEIRLPKTVALFLQINAGGFFKTAADIPFIHFSFPGVTGMRAMPLRNKMGNKAAAVNRAGTEFLERRNVSCCTVAFMSFEAVLRVYGIKLPHQAVTRYLRHNTGGTY